MLIVIGEAKRKINVKKSKRRDFWSKDCGMWSGRQNVTNEQQEENLNFM